MSAPLLAILVVLLLTGPPGVAAGEPSLPKGSQAQLVLSASEYDFGRLEPGRFTASGLISIRNVGAGVLEIRKIRTSCGCLTVNVSASRLPPGTEGTLHVQVSAAGLEEASPEQVLIYSNDPARPLVKVLIYASVWSPIEVSPSGVWIGDVNRGALKKAPFLAVRVASKDGTPFGPIRLTPSTPFIRAEAVPEKDGVYEVRVTLDPSVPRGRFNHTLRIEAEHPRLPAIEVPIWGTITGDLWPRVARIDFGLVEEGRPAAQKFTLQNRGSREVRIMRSGVKLAVPAEVEVSPTGKDFDITVRIPSPPPLASLAGTLDLHTDHPDEPVISLPVAGGVLAKRPFEQAAAEGSDARLFALVKEGLSRGEKISADDFVKFVLGGVRDDRAVSLLLGAAAENDLRIRMQAVQLLGVLKSPQALDFLKTAVTDDPHEFVRRAAVAALAEVAGRQAVPDLLLAIQDNDDWVREDAARALGRLGNPRAISALREALKDPEADVREAAQEALDSLRAKGEEN